MVGAVTEQCFIISAAVGMNIWATPALHGRVAWEVVAGLMFHFIIYHYCYHFPLLVCIHIHQFAFIDF